MKIDFSPRASATDKKICKTVATTLCEYLNQDAKMQADINFVSPKEIKTLNKTFRSIDAITDTLSFPFVNLGWGEKVDNIKHRFQSAYGNYVMLGEVYLNIEKILTQAQEYGHSYERELAYLTAHSLLHLFGYGHDNDEDEKEMTMLCEKITELAGYQR